MWVLVTQTEVLMFSWQTFYSAIYTALRFFGGGGAESLTGLDFAMSLRRDQRFTFTNTITYSG